VTRVPHVLTVPALVGVDPSPVASLTPDADLAQADLALPTVELVQPFDLPPRYVPILWRVFVTNALVLAALAVITMDVTARRQAEEQVHTQAAAGVVGLLHRDVCHEAVSSGPCQ
jgi:hypothetical protein